MEQNFYADQAQNPKRRMVLGVSTLVALIILGGGWWYLQSRNGAEQEQEGVVVEKSLPPLSNESRGKLPEGFPAYYIFGVSPEVVSASASPVEPGSDLTYEASIKTENHPRSLYGEYLEYLQATQWVISESYIGAEAGSIVAEKGTRRMVLAFAPEGRSTMLRMTYIVRQ